MVTIKFKAKSGNITFFGLNIFGLIITTNRAIKNAGLKPDLDYELIKDSTLTKRRE